MIEQVAFVRLIPADLVGWNRPEVQAAGVRGGEDARAEALVLRGSRRAWRRYLAEALALAGSSDDPAVHDARALVEDVVHNHDNLELAL